MKPIETDKYIRLKNYFIDSQKIVIIAHVNPDGDALGSSLGLNQVLCGSGHEVTVISPNEYPEFLNWMPGNSEVLLYSRKKNESKIKIEQASIIFALDFNEQKRCGDILPVLKESKALKIMIDHHPDPEPFCDFTFSETKVSSTAELVCNFIHNMGWDSQITKNAAECLLAGIITDTGMFNHNSSKSETFLAVAMLLEAGADKEYIIHHIYNNYSTDRMRLLGYCLGKMVVLPQYRTAYFSLSIEEMKKFNYQDGDTEGFVNYPLSINNIICSALFIEKSDHTKISIRSIGNFNVNQIAREHFMGGGHENASGGRANLSLADTIKKFENLLPLYAEQLKQV